MEFGFGSGAGYMVSNIGATPTPVQLGVLQSASVDFKASTKSLFGTNQLPVAVARGTVAVSGKASIAQMKGRLLSDIFFGDGLVAGQLLLTLPAEADTIPSESTYTITVSNAETFVTDYGVMYGATGIPLTRVASVSAAGTYSVDTATGVYTFDSADDSKAVNISYSYTATGGNNIVLANQPMGDAPTFQFVLGMPYNQQLSTITLNACVASSMSWATKLEDFTMMDMEFGAFVNAAGNLGTISVAELS
jgi:hypothetical protein